MVDKKGSLIGRKVGDFTLFNKVSEDYYYPAPEADQVLMNACGKLYHTLMDCVWGFSQISVDEQTEVLLSTITPFGVYKTKRLPEGVKQGPSIYQHVQDSALGAEFKPSGEKLCSVFFDDTYIGDHTVEERYTSLERVLQLARKVNIQYRLVKCTFFQAFVLLLRFICGKDGRTADSQED